MAVIQVESVAITKSRLAKGFNGDNLNLGGKVVSAEEADRGFKAAGNIKPPYVAVVASGNQKGFAAGAAAAFNDYTKDIHVNKYNAQSVIYSFFDDMDSVVENCSIEGAKLSIGIVCVYNDCVIAAKTGGCHLLRFSQGELFEIALSDDEDGRGFQFVDVVADGDIFTLVGAEASSNLDYDSIVSVFDSGNDSKIMIKDMFKLLATSAAGKDCSLVIAKLACDSEHTYAAIPMSEPAAQEQYDSVPTPDDFAAEPPIGQDELYSDSNYVSNYEMPQSGKKPNAKKRIMSFIPIAVLVIILAVTAALYLATRPSKDNKDNDKTPSETTSAESEPAGNIADLFTQETTESFTGSMSGNDDIINVTDPENGGNPGNMGGNNNSGSENTTEEENTTDEETTVEDESTTEEESTAEGESTTEEETTAQEETTVQEETTTQNETQEQPQSDEPQVEEPTGAVTDE